MSEYQSAAASNDLAGERRALLRLVQAKDDVSEYWTELGKFDASVGEYGDAYYAFTRAYELDRSNPDLVRAITQLALRSGDLATAQARAEELEILVPGDPWVKLTKGWAAVGELRYDEGLAIADELLSQAPLDPAATVLKARSLIGLGRDDEAIAVLKTQLPLVSTNVGALSLLAQIYERHGDWPNVAGIRQKLAQATPGDQENLAGLINAALRSNNVPLARSASMQLLQPQAPPTLVAKIMGLWTAQWPSPQRIEDAERLAEGAPPAQKLVYADFLNRWGTPAGAIRLVGNGASLPVNARNAEANAVLGTALARLGRVPEAKARLDAVIAYDPGNATALRGRTELDLRLRSPHAAVEDAQKLVTVVPNSAQDRILLSQAYTAAGDQGSANRTLWQAFHDIPANDNIFAALRSTRAGDPTAAAELQAEFDRQRDAQIRNGLV